MVNINTNISYLYYTSIQNFKKTNFHLFTFCAGKMYFIHWICISTKFSSIEYASLLHGKLLKLSNPWQGDQEQRQGQNKFLQIYFVIFTQTWWYQISNKYEISHVLINGKIWPGRPAKPGKGGSKPKPKPTAIFDKFTKKKTGL